jgi:hypothetical protein
MKQTIEMSIEDYEAGVDESDGMCLSCWETQYGGCEPDAEKYKCDGCGSMSVMGFELALISGHITLMEDEK